MRKWFAIVLTASLATAASAQVPPETAQPGVTSARSYTFEWLISAAVFAGALYETCRPGNRQQA